MYEAYWGLREKPFENTPDPRFLYLSADTEEIFTRLLYALTGNRGAALLTGASGCGKTLVTRALLQQMDPERTEIALINDPSVAPEDFVREVLYDFHGLGKQTLVVIDEGQRMEDTALLEEIRLLLNFQLNDAFLITLLLVGQKPLGERVRKYAPLDQRIATRGILKPMSGDDVQSYVAHRLAVAGRDEEVFTPEALDLVGEYSGGIARKVNNICDIALVIGFSRKLDAIDAEWMRRLIQTEMSDGA